MTADPMTHPSPEAVEKTDDATLAFARKYAEVTRRSKYHDNADVAVLALDAHVTALTAQLEAETARADKAVAEAKALREALKEVVSTFDDLISESGGVYGLHLNGDPAPWESLMAGGRFEEWTSGLEVARATLAQPADDGGKT